MSLDLIHGASVAIPFSISDASGRLLGKRVTWSIAPAGARTGERALAKASDLGASTAAVTLTTHAIDAIAGTINLVPADFANLPPGDYLATLWVDDGTASYCATAGGAETVTVLPSAPRG